MSSKRYRSRSWCFTDFELLDHSALFNDYTGIVRYVGWGREVCPTTNKVHYQGWIQFINPKGMVSVKKYFDSKGIHLEATRGSAAANETYCRKSGNFQSMGTFIKQGARSDLEVIKGKIDNEEKMVEIASSNFGAYVRYHKGFAAYKQLKAKASTTMFRRVNVTLIKGPTGTGKTRLAVGVGLPMYKIQGSDMQWFDGYEGERRLVIDEYSNDVKITKLLGILDGYQLRLPIKGGFTYAAWDEVFITTNLHILHERASQAHRDALARRITRTIDLWDQGALPVLMRQNAEVYDDDTVTL